MTETAQEYVERVMRVLEDANRDLSLRDYKTFLEEIITEAEARYEALRSDQSHNE